MGAVIKLGRNGAVVDDSGRIARQVGFLVRFLDLTAAWHDSDADRAIQGAPSAAEGVRADSQARVYEGVRYPERVCARTCQQGRRTGWRATQG